MPAFSLTYMGVLQEIAEVENALLEGYPPTTFIGSHHKTALRVAANRLNVDPQSMRRRIGTIESPGTFWQKFKLKVEWALYKPNPKESLVSPPDTQEIPSDPILIRRLRDENANLRTSLANSERRAGEAENIRSSVLGLASDPPRAKLIIPKIKHGLSKGRIVILHLSDVHYGETVSLDEMDGLNRYNAEIARTRIGRFFGTSASLMTEHWSGKKPDEIVLCLGGDLISGMIHDELLQTNVPSVPHTVRDIGDLISGGISVLQKEVESPIRVYSVPGNHGRMSHKPQSKNRAATSLDLLATDFAEAGCRDIKNVTFYRSASPDAYFSTFGWHWCLTHGDTMGGRGGGTGFIGPMAAIIKGHRKLVDTSWRSGRPVHYVLTAHYHTTGKTAFGWSNGSVVGYGEYARDLRADPEPARQNMLTVHAEHGVINEQPLYLGHPSEGSLYAGPASVIRPQWDEKNV